MKCLKPLIISSLMLLIGCKSNQNLQYIPDQLIVNEITRSSIKNWHFMDVELDTIPGISLHRAYDSLLRSRKPRQKVIVSVLDNKPDLMHYGLANKFWINKKEIPNNDVDDDDNGYIDDVQGWNFIANLKGESNTFVNFETTRILKKLTPYFQTKDTTRLSLEDSNLFTYYKKVLDKQEQKSSYYTELLQAGKQYLDYYTAADKQLAPYFIGKSYTLESLDSLKITNNHGVEDIHFLIMSASIKEKVDKKFLENRFNHRSNIIDILLNTEYDDRLIQGDDPENIDDINYGTSITTYSGELLDHGTNISGIISNIAMANEVALMPIAISTYGDEHDKDTALAIRYAVDNGAKVINMSIGKEFSEHKEWVFDALKYAERNDVLIISSAGNDNYDLSAFNDYYPNDNIDNDSEIVNNFLLVGASNFILNKNFKISYSNYGVMDVDLFTPGISIYTMKPNNKYTLKFEGTSAAAAITSGVAALIRSYYPDLTASQVKHILMDSGIEYTLEVSTPTKEDPEKTTPFNQLSKSGKVLNAYNALLMAEKLSKEKR